MFRTPEEKHSLYRPTGYVAAVTRIQNEIEELWQKDSEFSVIQEFSSRFHEREKAFLDECEEQLNKIGISEEEKEEFTIWFRDKREKMTSFKTKLQTWLKNNEPVMERRKAASIVSGVTNRSGSARSSTSSVRAALALKKAKLKAQQEEEGTLAALEEEKLRLHYKAELEQLKVQRQLEEVQRRQEQREVEYLETELEILDGTQREEDVHREHAESSLPRNVILGENATPEGSGININSFNNIKNKNLSHNHSVYPAFTGQNNVSNDQLAHIFNTMIKSQESNFLPQSEPFAFDGKDITKFRSWVCAFRSQIERHCTRDDAKYYFLEKYTEGQARKLVQSCNAGNPEAAYMPAMKLLNQQYGNEFAIAQTYIKKLEEWPKVESEDGKALEELSIFLLTCKNALEGTNSLHQLNNASEIEKIVLKLPFDMRKRYRHLFRKAVLSGSVSFQHLLDFISEAASELNMPVLGNIKDKKQEKGFLKNKKVFTTNASSDSKTNKIECPQCKKSNHSLDSCFFFAKKSNEDKLTFLKEKQLCFSCLSPNHRSNYCRNRLVCKHCKGKHPSSLHRPTKKESTKPSQSSEAEISAALPESTPDELSGACGPHPSLCEKEGGKVLTTRADSSTRADECRELSPAIPVIVKIKGSKHHTYTYMALDGFSTDCFASCELIKKIGAIGSSANFSLTTMHGQRNIGCQKFSDIEVYSLDGKIMRSIPQVFSHKNWPFSRNDSPRKSDVEGVDHLKGLPIDFIEEDIGLLVGRCVPELHMPLEVVCGEAHEMFASRHVLGWALLGPTHSGLKSNKMCNYIKFNSFDIEQKLENLYKLDFEDCGSSEQDYSFDDRNWINKVENSIRLRPDNHFEINLPFRDEESMPNNFRQVQGRLETLKKKFLKEPDFFREYTIFITEMMSRGYMEEVPETEIQTIPGKVWYLTHFAIRHPRKNKLRVVFDCSLKNAGVCLNDKLLQGPTLINNLIAVLMKFRQEPIAFMGDVEKMFFQVMVPPHHSDFMRILWFPQCNLEEKPKEYRINSHIFGAVSSPSIACYALQHTTRIAPKECSEEAKKAVMENFYMDDLLKSVKTEDQAISIIQEVTNILSLGGFNLTSFVSNSRKVLNSLPREKLAKEYKNLDFNSEDLPQDRILGVRWAVEEDCLGFRIDAHSRESTRRNMLSTVSGVFDPLGLAGPVIVSGRLLFQETCRLKLGWDEILPQELDLHWQKWFNDIKLLENYKICRCLKPLYFTETDMQLHIFCDGSSKAYGAAAYVRYVSESLKIHCSLLMSKARLTPVGNSSLKTIPRIELNGARLAVQLFQILKNSLSLTFSKEVFWTDSQTVLKYLNNDSARFQRFVANRVAFIRSNTQPDQWRYVPGEQNVADVLSRGSSADSFLLNKDWNSGPQFLWSDENQWKFAPHPSDSEYDMEIITNKKVLKSEKVEVTATERLLLSTSDWQKIIYRVSAFLRFETTLKTKETISGLFSVKELAEAEHSIWKYIQQNEFTSEITILRSNKPLKKNDRLRKLCPFLDNKGLLRVGGRLEKSEEEESVKHPIILPHNHHVVEVLVRQYHKENGHMGQNYVLSVLKEKYWIIKANGLIRRVIGKCITCRKYSARPSQQLMAPLPTDRVRGGFPPFWSAGIDFFGPFMVTRGKSRAQEKRYGVVFSCLASRALHLEVAFSLETSSFIDALRRFLARRGRIQTIHCDNGTNLVGACKQLKESLDQWNQSKLEQWCQQREIEWKFHPPSASHFGGIYEREIRSVRKILNALVHEQPQKMNDEVLQTLMCEAEAILNNRPLTPLSSDPFDLSPLTPNHVLLLHPEPSLPPGNFEVNDCYVKARWKRIQHLADVFWLRWRKEYLRILQERQKWVVPRRSHEVGDLVLVVDNLLPRNQWGLGRVIEIKSDENGHVRTAKVRVSRCKNARDLNISFTEIERPVVKLILLEPNRKPN